MKIIAAIILAILPLNAPYAQKIIGTSAAGSIGMQPYRIAYRDIVSRENTATITEADYKSFIANFSESPLRDKVNLQLGVFYQNRGFYDEALSIFDDLNTNSQSQWKDEARLHRAEVIKQKGMFENAVSEFKQVVEETTDPRIAADGLLSMARLYTELNELSDAEQAYLRLTKEYGNSGREDQALLEYGTLKIRQGDENSAKQLFEELVETYPQSSMAPLAYEALTEIQLRENDFTGALANTIRGLEVNVDPEFEAGLLGRKGDLLLKMGKYDEAGGTFRQLLQEYSSMGYQDEALLGLAITFREQGNFNDMRLKFSELEELVSSAEGLSFNLLQMDSVHIRLTEEKPIYLSTLSGARLQLPESALPIGADLTMFSIPTPENLESLPVLGRLYEVKSSTSFNAPVTVSLPFEELDENDKDVSYKIYQYKNDKWQELPDMLVDLQRRVVEGTLTDPGILAIMYEKPVILSFRDIFFGFNSTELTPSSIAQLDTVIRMMNKFKDVEVEIAGHTDDIGGDEVNLELSQNRASVIQDYLSSRGINSQRIIPRGYGERFPIASNETEEGRSRNRRTEFIVISGGKGAVLTENTRKRKFAIQLGKFPYPTQALEQKSLISRSQYPVEVIHQKEANNINYLVWLGRFDTQETAEQTLRQLQLEYKAFSYQIVQRW